MRRVWKSWLLYREGRSLSRHSPEDIFRVYYETNVWGDQYSRSGRGSNLTSTAALRDGLPLLWRDLGIRSMLDVPCGDFAWMRHVDLSGITYIGGDVVDALVESNRRKYRSPGIEFRRINLIADTLPKTDLVFCRDCLVHFSLEHIYRSLANIKASGARWLMTTHFPETGRNIDIVTGQWRPLDLEKAPFNFPPPVRSLRERLSDEPSGTAQTDKSLAVWAVSDLPALAAPPI